MISWSGIEQFGHRIQPLMKTRAGKSPSPAALAQTGSAPAFA